MKRAITIFFLRTTFPSSSAWRYIIQIFNEYPSVNVTPSSIKTRYLTAGSVFSYTRSFAYQKGFEIVHEKWTRLMGLEYDLFERHWQVVYRTSTSVCMCPPMRINAYVYASWLGEKKKIDKYLGYAMRPQLTKNFLTRSHRSMKSQTVNQYFNERRFFGF